MWTHIIARKQMVRHNTCLYRINRAPYTWTRATACEQRPKLRWAVARTRERKRKRATVLFILFAVWTRLPISNTHTHTHTYTGADGRRENAEAFGTRTCAYSPKLIISPPWPVANTHNIFSFRFYDAKQTKNFALYRAQWDERMCVCLVVRSRWHSEHTENVV